MVLNALKVILPGYDKVNNVAAPNTQLAAVSTSQTGLEQIFIQNRYAMTLPTVVFPACHLEAGGQHYERNSQLSYHGLLSVELEYYDRWDLQAATIDTVRASIAADLERLKSNIESNESLAQGGIAYTVSIPHISLSPYMGSEVDDLIPGMTFIMRSMSMHINLLPYDATT